MNQPCRPRGEVFTSGEVAAICRVSVLSINRAIDGGSMPGFHVPGSSHRRVTREGLDAYMAAKGLPAQWLADWLAEHAGRPSAPTSAPASAEPSRSVVRLDTPPAVAGDVVSALTPADLDDCVVLFKLTPGRDKVSLHSTVGGETVPKLNVVLPEGTAHLIRLLLLRTLHETAAVAAGERYAV